MSLYEASENTAYASPALPAQQIGHKNGYFKDLFCENINVATGSGTGLTYVEDTDELVPLENSVNFNLRATYADMINKRVIYTPSAVFSLVNMTDVSVNTPVDVISLADSISYKWGEWYPVLMGFKSDTNDFNGALNGVTFSKGALPYEFVQVTVAYYGSIAGTTANVQVLMLNRRLGW